MGREPRKKKTKMQTLECTVHKTVGHKNSFGNLTDFFFLLLLGYLGVKNSFFVEDTPHLWYPIQMFCFHVRICIRGRRHFDFMFCSDNHLFGIKNNKLLLRKLNLVLGIFIESGVWISWFKLKSLYSFLHVSTWKWIPILMSANKNAVFWNLDLFLRFGI